ncbi:hypothetical protein QFC24_006460 [Naganishia onofrii]|uniref:Uncharacterized protein n=1 Tax=Naganishia onofrii TaxID=1851511 RepID=A0ACC2X151_9TREE|nr:hypothetical protein QFC24_006460 [Naganishia onofrii]
MTTAKSLDLSTSLDGIYSGNRQFPLTGPAQGKFVDDIRTKVSSTSFKSSGHAMSNEEGKAASVEAIRACDARIFLSSGLLGKCPSLFDAIRNAIRFQDTSRSCATADAVYFDFDLLDQIPLSERLTKRDFERVVLPRFEASLKQAFTSGTAVIYAKTKIGGWAPDARQLDHVVPYVFFGLERLTQFDSGPAHLVLFDGTRERDKRREWDVRASSREENHEAHGRVGKDALVVDRIQAIFSIMAGHLRGRTSHNIPEIVDWDLPAVIQKADRGCALHTIINAGISTACRTEMLEALDTAWHSHAESNWQTAKNDLFDNVIPALFDRFGWCHRSRPTVADTTPSMLLFKESVDSGAQKNRKFCPSWQDYVLYECAVYVIYISIFGAEDSWQEYKNVPEVVSTLFNTADGVYRRHHKVEALRHRPDSVQDRDERADPDVASPHVAKRSRLTISAMAQANSRLRTGCVDALQTERELRYPRSISRDAGSSVPERHQ